MVNEKIYLNIDESGKCTLFWKSVSRILVLAILLFSSFLFRNHILLIVSLLTSSLFIIASPIYVGIPLYWIFIFSTQYYTYMNFSAARILGLALIFGLLIRTLRTISRRSNNLNAIFMPLIILIYSAFTLTLSLNYKAALGDYSMLFINVVLLIFLQLNDFRMERLNQLLFVATICSLVFAVLLVITNGKLLEGILSGDIGRVSMGDGQNAGEFGRNMVIYFGFLVSSLGSEINKHKLVKIIAVVISFLLIFLSGSRSSLVGAFTVFILNIVFSTKYKNTNLLPKIMWLGCLCIIAILLYNFSKYFDSILNRYTITSVIETRGTRRFDIWNLYLRHVIPDNLLLGVGIGGSSEIAALVRTGKANPFYVKPAHNMYLEFIIQLGLVGFFLFMSYFLGIARNFFKAGKAEKKDKEAYFYIFIALLIMAMGEPMFFSKNFWTVLMLLSKSSSNSRIHGLKKCEF